jgi:hypothetical protein
MDGRSPTVISEIDQDQTRSSETRHFEKETARIGWVKDRGRGWRLQNSNEMEARGRKIQARYHSGIWIDIPVPKIVWT